MIKDATPGTWFVRTQERLGEVRDCFVAAPDCNGFAYDAEVLGEDEYREDTGMVRKLADCHLMAASKDLFTALQDIIDGTPINPLNRNDDGLGDHGGSSDFARRIIAARAAIAKAQGIES